ncbi:3'-5' exoribonuclease domain-containing protein [Anabaena sp. CCY 9910]|uniref:3'-5' exoribonuclease domain-containing protein n=1 Tax=Anabaena sp. CCY 9910 TaxID=3103870 RepID=UPI0039DF8B7E
MTVRYFLDTEFIEDGSTIDLISIGIVSSDLREYYAINVDCDFSKANDWVKENVLKQLPPKPEPNQVTEEDILWETRRAIAKDIVCFIKQPFFKNDLTKLDYKAVKQIEPETGIDVEIWTYYGAYDWVVFCWLFGAMIDLPKGFPMYTNDIKQWCKQLGDPRLPEQGKGKHNALADAHWNKRAWEFLRKFEENCTVERG